jgi:hypothetical protein
MPCINNHNNLHADAVLTAMIDCHMLSSMNRLLVIIAIICVSFIIP